VTIVDSADTTAAAVVKVLQGGNLLTSRVDARLGPSVRFLATDGRERFARVAAYFLERPISAESVELIDPGFATVQIETPVQR
jgi:hypothetical protein